MPISANQDKSKVSTRSYGPDHAKVANVMLSLAKAKEYLLGDKGIEKGSRKQSLDYRLETLGVSFDFFIAFIKCRFLTFQRMNSYIRMQGHWLKVRSISTELSSKT